MAETVALYSMELLDDGKYRINVEWGNINNAQLNTFLNSVVGASDKVNNEIRKKINATAATKGQEKIVHALMTKDRKEKMSRKSPLYKPSEITRLHFLQSRGRVGGGSDDE